MRRNFAWLALALTTGGPALGEEAPVYVHEDVVVTATRFPEPWPDRPLDVTVIGPEEIERSPARTLPELLGRRAGFLHRDLFGNQGAAASLDLRGFGATADQNLLILLDGRPLNDIDQSGVQWSAVPLADVERIEVLRGGSVLWGAGTTAGVVNIITRRPDAPGVRGGLTLAAGSHGTRDMRAAAEATGESAGLRVSADVFRSDGYRESNRNETEAAAAHLLWRGAGRELALRVAADRQDLRLPGARTVQPSAGTDELREDRRGTATPLDWSSRDGNHLGLDARAETGFGEVALGVGYRDKTQTSYFDFGGFPDYRDARLDLLSLTPRVKLRHELFGVEHALVAGADLYWWDYDLALSNAPGNIGRPFNRVGAEQRNLAFYVQDSLHLAPATRLTLGLRSERQRIDAQDRHDPGAPGGAFGSGAPAASARYSEPAWQASLAHALRPGMTLIGRVGRSYRFANVDEIYEFSPAFSREFQPLRPQTAESVDLTADWQNATAGLRATIFRIDVDDEIHLDPFTTGVGNTNLPPTRRQGLELEGRWEPRRGLWLAGSYTFTRARFRSGVLPGGPLTATDVAIGGNTVPLVPTHRASAEATLELAAHTHLTAALLYVGSQFMDNDEENSLGVKIPSYTLCDLRLSHVAGPVTLTAAVHNLFDREYYSYAVRSQFVADRYNAYPLPERTFSVSAALSF